MARGKRKRTTQVLDRKIEEQKAVLEKAKLKYEAEKETLAGLIKLRNEMQKEELMEAVLKSEHTYAEIMAVNQPMLLDFFQHEYRMKRPSVNPAVERQTVLRYFY